MSAVPRIDHAPGDATGLALPAHPDAFAAAGAGWLTRAFRAFGSLDQGNAVAKVLSIRHCPGGSTGAKLFVDVRYATPAADLPERLFVKFSRDFADERRDGRGRWEMQPEVPFQRLSRLPGFPIAVPRALFADYHGASGTGLVVTEAIPYGEGQIEPHRRKCMDHATLADPLAHYRAQVTALARLAAAHRSGRLSPDIDATFPFDPETGSADPIRYDEAGLRAELDRCFDFARRCPQLLPEDIRSPEFMAKMERDARAIRDHEPAIRAFLVGDERMRALCHWNAHIDNCFFWPDGRGALECGFIDWGRVGQITLGSVLWGGLSAAHHDIWDRHLDDLLALFAREYHAHGGPLVTPAELDFHLTLHMAAMGVARVLAFPEVVLFRLPECVDATGPLDPMFEGVDPARNSLHIYTVFLKHWRRRDFGTALERLLAG